jgi:hypothetical protein
MFKHIAYVRCVMVVAILACSGLATACSSAAPTKAPGQVHVKNVAAQAEDTPTSDPSLPTPTCTPTINTVGPFEVMAASTFEITGSCLGIGNTVSGADTGYFRIRDRTAGWNACWTGDPGTDVVTCKVSSWTNTGITFSGFTGGYGHNGWVITNGDHIQVEMWNPQSGKGPATCTGIAGRGAPTTC